MANESKSKTRTKKRVLIALAALAVIALLVLAWMPRAIAVDAAVVTRDVMEVAVEEAGRTRVKDRYTISAPVYGNLARIRLDPGSPIESGDVVARIAPLTPPLLDPRSRAETEARVAASRAAVRQAEATAERAVAALEHAEQELERQRRLQGEQATTQREIERAEIEVRQRREELISARFGARAARHQLEQSRAALEQAHGETDEAAGIQVTAPTQGVVLKVLQESAGVVQAGTPLLEIGDRNALEVVVEVLTQDAVRIPPGALAWLEHWGGEDVLEGRVRQVKPSAFTRVSALGVDEQRVKVVIELVDPPAKWAALGDGYRVECRIVTWRGDDVLQVPDGALFRVPEGQAVYRIDDGRARLRVVKVGHRDGVRAEILEGLEEGERIIAYPGDRIEDGVRVSSR